jgi:lipoate-protein ligase A
VNGGPGSILHHVTMSYDIDAEKMGRILNTSAEKLSDKAVASVVKRIDPLRSQTGLSRDGIIRHLLQ